MILGITCVVYYLFCFLSAVPHDSVSFYHIGHRACFKNRGYTIDCMIASICIENLSFILYRADRQDSNMVETCI